ncbi:protein phosphatase 1L isoform X3 [Bos mutus]|uniref:protein phosphatase 1L isoform X3 n=1 Tax=Bos mutus TaxID=72004 RepID=UPI0038B50412
MKTRKFLSATADGPPKALGRFCLEGSHGSRGTVECWSSKLEPAATAKSLQSCPTLCDPIDGSPPGSAILGILQSGHHSKGPGISYFWILWNLSQSTTSGREAFRSICFEEESQTAAEYVKSRLPEALKQHLQDYEKDKENSVLSYQTILEQQILSIDREMLEKLTVSYDEAGTTCLIALLSDKDLTVANVGDSRGVLCDKDGNAIPLSHDHKPYQLKERKRIKRAGGFISFNGSWRVQGILAMSRSLGDYPLKNLNVVIPDPDILTFDLDKLQPEFMILASDGLWDAFSNEEAVRFIKDRLDEPHFGAKSIVLQSFYRGCPDNITVMVVKFRNSSKTEEQ